MKTTKNNLETKTSESRPRSYNFREFFEHAKKLQGDPHYVAMGMAIGVFVAITPTIPFHNQSLKKAWDLPEYF